MAPPPPAALLAVQTAAAFALPVLALCLGALLGHLLSNYLPAIGVQDASARAELWSIAGGVTGLGGICWRDLARRPRARNTDASADAHRGGEPQ